MQGRGISLEEDELDVLAAFDADTVVRLMQPLERGLEPCLGAKPRPDQPLQRLALFDCQVALTHAASNTGYLLFADKLRAAAAPDIDLCQAGTG